MDENDRLTIDYSFQIRTLECHVWNMKTMSWDSSGCYSGNETTLNRLHCRCTHFGGFSGTVLIPSSNVDPVLDIDVYLISASNNAVILFFVLTILVVYFLILIWTYVKDKQDIFKNEVIILGDNCPGDSYPYLVAVYTGYQRNAGTSSVVGIKLVGDKDKSMNHILVSGSKAIHSRSSDNFFVLLEARRLGSISYISLWHNCSGHHAAWYCDRIVVTDLLQNQVWTFLVRRWLSVMHEGCTLRCVLFPATVEALYDWKVLFAGHLYLGFQEQHVWTSIFLRHRRSTYTRTQRLCVALSITMATIITSILLSGIPVDDPAEELGENIFQLFGWQLLCTVAGAFLTAPVTFLFALLFRKTAPSDELFYCTRVEGSSTDPPPDAEVEPQKTEGEMGREKWWSSLLTFIMMEPLIPNLRLESRDRLKSKSQDADTSLGDMKHTSEDRGRKRKRKSFYWFPPWFIIVISILCALIVSFSATSSVIFGLKFSLMRSQMWVAAVLTAFLLSVFVVQPLKVVIFAFILSRLLKKQPSMYSQQQYTDGFRPWYAQKLSEIQQQNMHQPPDSTVILLQPKTLSSMDRPQIV
ncbi:Polycystic kidney disease protein 1-like 2 [Zootermopsis nevadensis]|nr:Polycystic kidney disease protein 1-like 2 [Zootermopsis nevadensis]